MTATAHLLHIFTIWRIRSLASAPSSRIEDPVKARKAPSRESVPVCCFSSCGDPWAAGWPWRLLARAPTDPYVLALEHTVPQPADLPPAKDPEAIRSSYGDMGWNLDGF